MLGAPVPSRDDVQADGRPRGRHALDFPLVASLRWDKSLAAAGTRVRHSIRAPRRSRRDRHRFAGEMVPLYGAFQFLRLLQTEQPIADLDVTERPRIQRRLLDHWDNLDGTIERGYAGRSLWNWDELPGRVDPRVQDYARANASIGINGSVINSVNANPKSLTAEYIAKTGRSADTLRPYGIRAYLSANFAAPKMIGGLATADPLDPAVAKWWARQGRRDLRAHPGLRRLRHQGQQRGPARSRTTTTAPMRTGANVLADAGQEPRRRRDVPGLRVRRERGPRSRQARLQGVRSPWTAASATTCSCRSRTAPSTSSRASRSIPLFGAIPKTPIMAELQITQEYLGQSTHLVYLRPMWKEFLDADTFAKGPGSTVAKVVDGTLEGHTRPASRAWPTRAATRTGPATTSPRPTGTPSAAWPGTRRSPRRPSPTNGSA
jgi:alpha-glucuronidase